MDHATRPYQIRESWWLALAGCWQSTAGLTRRSSREDVLRALQGALAAPDDSRSKFEELLLRGYRLDLARGLRAMETRIPSHARDTLRQLIDWLEMALPEAQHLSDRILDLIDRIQRPESVACSDRLAQTVQSLLKGPVRGRVSATFPGQQLLPTTTSTGTKPDSIATKLIDTARRVSCAVIPSARVMALDGAVGALVSPTGAITATINYDTGMVELGTAGGVTMGWNGGATGNVSAGLSWGTRTPGPNPVVLGGTASAKALFGGGLSGQRVEGTFSLSAQIGVGLPSVSAGMTVMKPGPVVAAGSVARYGTGPDVALTIVRNRVCR